MECHSFNAVMPARSLSSQKTEVIKTQIKGALLAVTFCHSPPKPAGESRGERRRQKVIFGDAYTKVEKPRQVGIISPKW